MYIVHKIRFNVIFAAVFMLSLIIMTCPGQAQAQALNLKTNKCFVIGYANTESSIISPFKAPLRQVYSNIDQCVVYLQLPYARLMKMVSNNEIDAIMGRSLPAIINYPNLPYVPTPVANFKAYLVTNPSAAENVKADIKNLGFYNVGGLTGSDWSMQTMGKLAKDFKCTENIDQLVSMYTRKRLDGFLVSDFFLPHVFHKLFKEKNATFQTVMLYDVPIYHVLAPKHAGMVSALDDSVNTVLAQISNVAALAMLSPKVPL